MEPLTRQKRPNVVQVRQLIEQLIQGLARYGYDMVNIPHPPELKQDHP